MKVSVVLPTYNREYCLGKAIDSILAQTYSDMELIIVDDCSTDATKELVESYQSKTDKIQYIRLDTNGKVANARNIGMKASKGAYVAFQDSDDYWHPEKLEKQLKAIECFEADFAYCYCKYDMENQEVVIPNRDISLDCMNGDIYARLLHGNMIGTPALIMKRECYEKIGEFDTSLPALEDYDYVLRLSKEYKAVFVAECLLDAGISQEGISSNPINHLMATCMLIGKYKNALIENKEFDYQVEKLYKMSQYVGVEDKIMSLLEKILAL